MGGSSHTRKGTPLLMLGAIGVVFGDIGTSPLYALRATLSLAGGEAGSQEQVLGVLSIMIWSLLVVIGLKYITLVMKADNGGEGGLFALLALARPREGHSKGENRRGLVWIALIGAALLYGDGIITPAISVLSAMGGVTAVHVGQQAHWVVVASAFIVIGIFFVQRLGSGRIGWLVGPVMLFWFILIGSLGARAVIASPEVLQAFSPLWGIKLIASAPLAAFVMLGGVVLCLTGGEALYADMGHFGRRAISLAWWIIVCPSLLLAYLGQGAVIMATPAAVGNPFFALVPEAWLVPMVVVATIAAIVASQAIISGVFSMTRQLSQHGLIPPIRVVHTSDVEGQIYLPSINLLMAIACVLIVLLFGTADRLAGAYGLAVTGVMVVTTVLFAIVARTRWQWSWWWLVPVIGVMLTIDVLFLAANALKILDGGWMPIGVALLILAIVGIWRTGMQRLHRSRLEGGLPLVRFLETLGDVPRCPGTGVFFAKEAALTPITIRKLQRHVPTLPETMVIVHMQALGVPRVPFQHRLRFEDNGHGVWLATVRFGYLQRPSIPEVIEAASEHGLPIDSPSVTYWVRRDQVVLGSDHHGMARWQVAIFAYLLRNATVLPDMLDLPPRRTVEIGMRSSL
jgi:KUP system potassium uptake protein